MLKAFIALVLFFACTYAGYAKALALGHELKAAEAAQRDLLQLGALMDYRLLPVEELAQALRTPGLKPLWDALVSGLSEGLTLNEAFGRAVKQAQINGRRLPEELQGILMEFGEGFGNSSLELQKKNIEYAVANIMRYAEQQREKLKAKGRLYKTLGVLGGMAAAILAW